MNLDSLLLAFAAAGSSAQPEAPQIIFRILAAIGFGVGLAMLYGFLGRTKEVKSSYIRTLIVLPLVAASILFVIGNNIVHAFGLIGAVSLIRFRMGVKNIQDMAFVFLSITLGTACGIGLVSIGVLVFVFFCLTMLSMELIKIGTRLKRGRRFVISVKTKDLASASRCIRNVFGPLSLFAELSQVTQGESGELRYTIVLSKNITEDELMERLAAVDDTISHQVLIKRQ
jgi:uncharacterized membrane protein YhiD involved in acid resistance